MDIQQLLAGMFAQGAMPGAMNDAMGISDAVPRGASPADRVQGGFTDAFPPPIQDDTAPPLARATAGTIPPDMQPVPIPRPRPAQAPLPPSGVPEGGPYNTGPGDPYKVAPPMWGPGAPNMGPRSDIDGPSKRDYGMLTALGIPPDKAAVIMRSLAGGLSNVKNSPFKGETISQALGGSLGGANKYEDDQDKRREGALDRAIKIKGQEDLNDYRQGSLERSNYGVAGQTPDGTPVYFDRRTGTEKVGGQVLAPKGGAGATGGVSRWKYDAWIKAHPGDEDGALQYASGQKKIGEGDINRLASIAARDDLRNNTSMLSAPQDKKDAYLKERMEFWRQQHRQGVATPGAPRAPASQGAPGAPAPTNGGRVNVDPALKPDAVPMISMKGGGSQADPYHPTTADDYAEIPSGAYYLHPDGKLRIKK